MQSLLRIRSHSSVVSLPFFCVSEERQSDGDGQFAVHVPQWIHEGRAEILFLLRSNKASGHPPAICDCARRVGLLSSSDKILLLLSCFDESYSISFSGSDKF